MGGFRGRAGFYLVSAGAGDYRAGMILGMYFFFHTVMYNIKVQTLQISVLDMEQCFLCPALGICGGGCPASIELASGSMWEIDKRICPHSIKTLEWLIWDLYEQME